MPYGPLIEWHRKRRAPTRNDSGESSFVAGSPRKSPEAQSCGSPSEFYREDMVRKNARRVDAEYDFKGVLGEGSFGKVHQAQHRRTGIMRAVKEIPHTGDEDFQLELQALQALDHPHIVEVIEYFLDVSSFFLVMELCTGPDVFTYILQRMDSPDSDGFVPEAEISVILRQCLKSVLCCHAHGFVHRDLNAKNFMITGDDRTVKLIDFGLATRFYGYLPQDQYIEIVGTSHYMAPEMILSGKYSPAVDMWSLGVLLYVCLTGLMLLPKDDDRKKHLLGKKAYVEKKLEKCSQLQKRGCSKQARELLGLMLRYDPTERISASAALSHHFILSHCHEYLNGAVLASTELDAAIIDKLRRFAKAPRLKKVAQLFMAHLAEHEPDLLVARHNFRTLDNGDGEITQADLEAGLVASGIELPEDMVEIFEGCSSHREGKLHFVEFLACMMPASLIDERLCHEAFNLLDPEGKGRLKAEDLQAVCHFDWERCRRMVQQANPVDDSKDYFDFEDFYTLFCEQEAARPLKAPRLAGATSAS